MPARAPARTWAARASSSAGPETLSTQTLIAPCSPKTTLKNSQELGQPYQQEAAEGVAPEAADGAGGMALIRTKCVQGRRPGAGCVPPRLWLAACAGLLTWTRLTNGHWRRCLSACSLAHPPTHPPTRPPAYAGTAPRRWSSSAPACAAACGSCAATRTCTSAGCECRAAALLPACMRRPGCTCCCRVARLPLRCHCQQARAGSPPAPAAPLCPPSLSNARRPQRADHAAGAGGGHAVPAGGQGAAGGGRRRAQRHRLAHLRQQLPGQWRAAWGVAGHAFAPR